MTNRTPADALRTWIEPEVVSLDISETAISPARGVDGETLWVDCTS